MDAISSSSPSSTSPSMGSTRPDTSSASSPAAPSAPPVLNNADRVTTSNSTNDQAQSAQASSMVSGLQGTFAPRPAAVASSTPLDASKIAPAQDKNGVSKLQRPVLMVHGLNEGPEAFDALNKHLTEGGLNKSGGTLSKDNLDKIDPKSNVFQMGMSGKTNVSGMNKEELKKTVDAIRKQTGAEDVDIVAHSKGGLDSRNMLEDGNSHVKNLVTLGTPHKGAAMADWATQTSYGNAARDHLMGEGSKEAVKELSPSSDLIKKLGQGASAEQQNTRMMSVGGAGSMTPTEDGMEGDGVVSPKSSLLPGSTQVVANGCGHNDMLTNKAVLGQVSNFLNDRPVASAVDCTPPVDFTPLQLAMMGP